MADDIWFRLCVVVGLLLVSFNAHSAAHNAREAHRHTHELACHFGADHLCTYHERGHK